jgi:hypothetical protein
MMNTRKIESFILLVLLTSFTFAQQELYVSPNGNGDLFTEDNPGSIESLADKLERIRKRAKGDIKVFLKGGYYYLDKTLLLTEKTTGDKTDTVTITGAEDEKVILSGGKKVSKWEKVGNGIFRSRLPEGTDFRQLYVNGKMAVRARTPNRENDNDFGPYFRGLGFNAKDKTVWIRASEFSKWNNLNEVEMVIHQHWYQSRFRIESFIIGKDTAIITPIQPAREHLFMLTYAGLLNPDKPYYFENALKFLDQANEWYLDKSTATLYYKPPAGEFIDKLEIIYPVLNSVVKIKGDPIKPVWNIVLKNIEMAYGNWILPSYDGIIATQGVQGRGYAGDMEVGILQVDYARNVRIENCNIRCAGDNGIIFGKGVQVSEIRSSHIDQISANGIVMDTHKKASPHDSIACKNNRIENNLIENVGLHYTSGMGLIVSCVAKVTIESNEIRFGRYTGMQIGNHYGDNLSMMRDNLIRRNNIHHVMQLHDDGGAIYTLALQPGTKILSNWLHDFGRSQWADNFPVNAIFLDNNSGYIRVQDNVMTDLKNVDQIKEQHAGNATTRDNLLINNNTQEQDVKDDSGIKGKVGVIINNN